jgi:hypothetical protein
MGHPGSVGQVGGGSVVTVLMAPARLLPLPLLVLVALLTVLVAGEPVVAAARGPLATTCQVVAVAAARVVRPAAPLPLAVAAPVPDASAATPSAPVFPRHRSQAPPSAMMCAIHHHPEPSEGSHATSYHPHHRHPGGLPHL